MLRRAGQELGTLDRAQLEKDAPDRDTEGASAHRPAQQPGRHGSMAFGQLITAGLSGRRRGDPSACPATAAALDRRSRTWTAAVGIIGTMASPQDSTSASGLAGSGQTLAIHTEELTKVYPEADFAAVDRLNLDVRAGEIFGLLGPNGAGKTTTAGMLTTRVVPTSGRGFVGGVDVTAHPALVKQLSGIVSQQNTLDRQLTVSENLYFHGRLFGIGSKQSRLITDELLGQFQLTKWARASVYALSGGMAQRLMVARAIFHRPAVLFLDEPTAGLDPQSRLALWEMLGKLNGEGQTILLTTHYMEEADRLCNRVAIMDHGRILALGTPSELKQSVGADTVVTVKTSGDQGQLGELLASEIEGVTRTRSVDGAIQLHMQASERLVPRIVLAAERAGFDILDLSIAKPSLETVFINLTGKELRDS
jgi:ABC-2 type transport system ATP-binding protein